MLGMIKISLLVACGNLNFPSKYMLIKRSFLMKI
nr:MAG TPA: hypothetical protein [Caudoviricetes sp.]